MNPLTYALEESRRNVGVIDDRNAQIVVTVYHPESMDRPMTQTYEATQAQLATESNHRLVEHVRDLIDYQLHSIVSKWRGA